MNRNSLPPVTLLSISFPPKDAQPPPTVIFTVGKSPKGNNRYLVNNENEYTFLRGSTYNIKIDKKTSTKHPLTLSISNSDEKWDVVAPHIEWTAPKADRLFAKCKLHENRGSELHLFIVDPPPRVPSKK